MGKNNIWKDGILLSDRYIHTYIHSLFTVQLNNMIWGNGYKHWLTRLLCGCVCLQGCWLYILWDGCRSAAVPWFHCGGRAPPHLQVTGWVAATRRGGGQLQKGTNTHASGVNGLRLSGCHSVIFRHTHRGELAGNLVHRRIQILQLPQIQTATANQPCSQVPLPTTLTRLMFIFVLFAFIRCLCEQMHGRLFTRVLTWVSQTGNPVFTDSHPLPSSLEPLTSHQPLPQADT